MATYQVLARREKGNQIVVSKTRPKKIGMDFKGYIYNTIDKRIIPVGPEVFSRGYWVIDNGIIELDIPPDAENARRSRHPV